MNGRRMSTVSLRVQSLLMLAALALPAGVLAQALERVEVEGQPLAANVERVVRALESLGAPLPGETSAALVLAGATRDAAALQRLLDPYVLFAVTINPEERV